MVPDESHLLVQIVVLWGIQIISLGLLLWRVAMILGASGILCGFCLGTFCDSHFNNFDYLLRLRRLGIIASFRCCWVISFGFVRYASKFSPLDCHEVLPSCKLVAPFADLLLVPFVISLYPFDYLLHLCMHSTITILLPAIFMWWLACSWKKPYIAETATYIVLACLWSISFDVHQQMQNLIMLSHPFLNCVCLVIKYCDNFPFHPGSCIILPNNKVCTMQDELKFRNVLVVSLWNLHTILLIYCQKSVYAGGSW